MSDYTPTTEEVRNAYIEDEFGIPREFHLLPGFDRWLASVKAEAWDEGHHAGRLNETYRDHTRNFWRTPPTNPYREQEVT